jgi:predicted ATP-dependent protease
MDERKWQTIAFLFIFLFICSMVIGVFQYLSSNYYRESLEETERSLEELKKQFDETQNRINVFAVQLDYYKQQAKYYMQQAQSYQQKILEQAGGKNLGAQTLIAQMQAPAVRMEEDPFPKLVGIPITLIIEIRPGEGLILINTEPKMGIDLQASARTATQVAENFTGFSLVDRDVIISVKAPLAIESVDGPSAGASMAVLMIMAIEDREPRPDVMLTGTIDPDGGIGPVGGIVAKAEAAAETGASMFLIPEGQARQVVYKKVTRELLPGFRIATIEPTRIDIREYADENWGLEVIEIDNVTEALGYAAAS